MPGQVRFKFKSGLQPETVAFDGSFVSVGELKRLIAEKKRLGKDAGADLILSDPRTSEEYSDDSFQLPNHSYVEVRRAPVTKLKPLQPTKQAQQPTASAHPQAGAGATAEGNTDDDFGGDLYSEQPVQAVVHEDEAKMLQQRLDGTAASWQMEIQKAGRGRGRGRGRGERGVPPPQYVCHRCGQSGHFISDCPTNGDPTFDVKRVRIPVGIPMTRLARNQEGGLLLPDGQVGSLLPNDDAFTREMAWLPTIAGNSEPPEASQPASQSLSAQRPHPFENTAAQTNLQVPASQALPLKPDALSQDRTALAGRRESQPIVTDKTPQQPAAVRPVQPVMARSVQQPASDSTPPVASTGASAKQPPEFQGSKFPAAKPFVSKPAAPTSMEEPFLVGEEEPFSIAFPSVPSIKEKDKEPEGLTRLAQAAGHSGRGGSRLDMFESKAGRKSPVVSPSLPEPRYPRGLLPKGPVQYVLKAFDVSEPLSKREFEELQDEVRRRYGYEMRRRSDSLSRHRGRSVSRDRRTRRSTSYSRSPNRSRATHRSHRYSVERTPPRKRVSPSRSRQQRHKPHTTDSRTANGDASDDSLDTNARKGKHRRSRSRRTDGHNSRSARDAAEEQSAIVGTDVDRARPSAQEREKAATGVSNQRDARAIAAETRKKLVTSSHRELEEEEQGLPSPALRERCAREVDVDSSYRLAEERPPKRSRKERPATADVGRWDAAVASVVNGRELGSEEYDDDDYNEEVAAAAREFVEGTSGRNKDKMNEDKKRKKDKKLKKDRKKKKHKKQKEKADKHQTASEDNSDRSDTPVYESNSMLDRPHPLERQESEVHPLLRKESDYYILESEPSRQLERIKSVKAVGHSERSKDSKSRTLFGRAMASIHDKADDKPKQRSTRS